MHAAASTSSMRCFQGSVAGSAAAARGVSTRRRHRCRRGSDKVLPLLADAVVAVEDGRHQQALDAAAARAPASCRPGPVAVGRRVSRPPAAHRRGIRVGPGAARPRQTPAARRDISRPSRTPGIFGCFTPIEYVRSFYYLGQIAERAGRRRQGARILQALPVLLEGRRHRSRQGRGSDQEDVVITSAVC